MQIIDKPTRKVNILDLCVTKYSSKRITCSCSPKVLQETSDHNSILIHIFCTTQDDITPPTTHNIPHIESFDYEQAGKRNSNKSHKN